ncbi:rotamase FKBP 1 [Perilla frutescens var. hirtella]|nr:rotamase FKBP 1 [Perilla frutescens var. hirtella]
MVRVVIAIGEKRGNGGTESDNVFIFRVARTGRTVGFIEYDSSFSEEEKEQAKFLKVSCKLNNAACKLKLKNYKEAEKLCTEVLKADGKNVKALCRRAQAYINLVELELAKNDIKKALEIDPNNRDVKSEYKILMDKVKEYNRKDAQFYGSIFSKMSKLEQARSPQPLEASDRWSFLSGRWGTPRAGVSEFNSSAAVGAHRALGFKNP